MLFNWNLDYQIFKYQWISEPFILNSFWMKLKRWFITKKKWRKITPAPQAAQACYYQLLNVKTTSMYPMPFECCACILSGALCDNWLLVVTDQKKKQFSKRNWIEAEKVKWKRAAWVFLTIYKFTREYLNRIVCVCVVSVCMYPFYVLISLVLLSCNKWLMQSVIIGFNYARCFKIRS